MSRLLRRPPSARTGLATLAGVAVLGLGAAGCGGEIDVDEKDRPAAQLFEERCSGCHTLELANSHGSRPEGKVKGGERTDGPNFDVRKVKREDALYAIRNGGFSGAIMPANIVVGKDAERVADFLARYSGRLPPMAAAGEHAGP